MDEHPLDRLEVCDMCELMGRGEPKLCRDGKQKTSRSARACSEGCSGFVLIRYVLKYSASVNFALFQKTPPESAIREWHIVAFSGRLRRDARDSRATNCTTGRAKHAESSAVAIVAKIETRIRTFDTC